MKHHHGTRSAGALIALAAAAGIVTAAGAQTAQLNYSVGFGPASLFAKSAEAYAEYVGQISDDAVSIQVFPLGLVSLPEMKQGIRDGLTDVGFMAAPYYPAEFAHTNFLADNAILQLLEEPTGREGAAFAGAISEFILTQCPECLEEYRAQNHVYMGHISTSPYISLCGPEVVTLADVQGKRFRTGGSGFQRMAENFGGVAVQMPSPEAYEALNQGVLDCVWLAASDLSNLRLIEIVRNVTMRFPGFVFGGTVAGNINRDSWAGLTPEQREAMMRGTAFLKAHMTWSYYVLEEQDLEAARAQGATIHEPDDEMIEGIREFVRADLGRLNEIYTGNFGLARGEEMTEAFYEVLRRWTDLVAEVETIEDLAAIYWDEIWSQVDPASHGITN
jgi:TRAP-type transport system periplasmic protein